MDESRIVKGMFKTRNFLEGLLLAVIVLPIAFLIPIASDYLRFMVVVAVCGPFFLLGNAGFNGDPLSTTVINAYHWKKTRGIMLFNHNVRALIKSPLTAMMEKELPRDRIVDMLDNIKDKQKERAAKIRYIEGETFEFVDDTELEDIYADKYYYVDMMEDEHGNLIEIPKDEGTERAKTQPDVPAPVNIPEIKDAEQAEKKRGVELNLDDIFDN